VRRLATAASILIAVLLLAPSAAAQVGLDPAPPQPAQPAPVPPHSIAAGEPWHGRLVNGMQLPESGAGFLTWDFPLKRIPNRGWRRWGTDVLVALIERVLGEYASAHPAALPVLVGDLSRPAGGVFDKRYGGLGHSSHQNGLDVDIFYPRIDLVERAPWRPEQVDRVLAQDLVDRFVAAGAQRIFVGPHVGLHGPPRIVQVLAHHDDHFHVRIPNPGRPAK
jgi:murein endopeptidase